MSYHEEFSTVSLPISTFQAQRIPFTGLFVSRPKWHTWKNAALDLFFPPCCASCGRVDTHWCSRCEDALADIPVRPCHQSVEGQIDIRATALHQGILANAIHALKYEQTPQLARPLAERLAMILAEWDIQPDVLIPVPLHHQRWQERGYNQSALLAWELSTLSGIPLNVDGVQRTRETRAQVGLDRQNRLINVADAFNAQPLDGGCVLLIDDVCTTGATLFQCAQALKDAGANQVYGLTVSIANHSGNRFTDEPLKAYLKESL
jgi:ComF family protein